MLFQEHDTRSAQMFSALYLVERHVVYAQLYCFNYLEYVVDFHCVVYEDLYPL